MEEKWYRKRIRLEGYDYATPGFYFVTICTKDRAQIFWENVEVAISRQNPPQLSAIGKIVDAAINQISEHYLCVTVDKYCIMPDHVHMILRINADKFGQQGSATTISAVVGQMKRWVSKQVGSPVWQKSFVDRVIRNEKGYFAVWEYIDNNPIRIDFADDNIDFVMM